MTLNLHPYHNPYGFPILEVESKTTRVLFDSGRYTDERLAGSYEVPRASLAGTDGVFFSCYISDHPDRLSEFFGDTPLFFGAGVHTLLKAHAEFSETQFPKYYQLFRAGNQVQIGDITVSPLMVGHSPFDSYMFLIHCNDESILYTGDLRSAGRLQSGEWLSRIPTRIQTLICEGGVLGTKQPRITEKEIEEQITEILERPGPVFVLQTPMDLMRLVTVYRACKRSGRLLIEDEETGVLSCAAGGAIPNPISFQDAKVYSTQSHAKGTVRHGIIASFGTGRIRKARILSTPFALYVRPTSIDYLSTLGEKLDFSSATLLYTQWEGYRNEKETQSFLDACQAFGMKIESVQTSQQDSTDALDALIRHCHPNKIFPLLPGSEPYVTKRYPAIELCTPE